LINFVTELPASLCNPINFVTELPATLCRIVICTSVNTTWRTAGLIQDFMERAEPMPTFLLDTNIQNSKMQLASSFAFNPVQ
jgi:hypothetical protein